MSKQGFILLHRSIQDHWIYEEKRKFSRYEAWLDLLMMVNHKDSRTLQDGQLVEVKRGERITSIRQLMDRWDWSNTKVIKFLELLQKDGMISFEVTPKKKTLIKILQYEQYQGFGVGEQSQKQTAERHETDSETTQNNINNNDNNDNKKDNARKRDKRIYEKSSIHFQLANSLYQKILDNNPQHKLPDLQKWSNDIRLMMDRDGRTEEQIAYLIDWCQNNDFWKSNILSPSKLREKFDQLVMQVKVGRKATAETIIPNYEEGEPHEKDNEQHLNQHGNVRLYR